MRHAPWHPSQIRAVYLLVRGKRTLSAAERVQKLLCCPLFSQLHKQVAHGCENVFCKVKTVAGDLSLPGLGLSDADAQVIRSSVDMVIHCAANVVLDADIQGTLRSVSWQGQAADAVPLCLGCRSTCSCCSILHQAGSCPYMCCQRLVRHQLAWRLDCAIQQWRCSSTGLVM